MPGQMPSEPAPFRSAPAASGGGPLASVAKLAAQSTPAKAGAHSKPPEHRLPQPLKEAQQWECGERRNQLRNEFNTKEIDAATLIAKYDTNNNRMLERDELAYLLRDFNSGIVVKPDELDFIMKIADVNQDKAINENEVLYAVRVWYAIKHKPDSVDRAMARYGIRKEGPSPLPSSEALKELLETLNDSASVKEAEVEYVRSVAIFLGGHDAKANRPGSFPSMVTEKDMWRAIACWYLNIERGETADSDLWKHSFGSLHAKLADLNVAGKTIDYTARGTLITLASLVAIIAGVPMLSMVVAGNNPNSVQCESPNLAGLLWWTGFVGIINLSLFFIASTVMTLCPGWQMSGMALWLAFGILSIVYLMLYVIGSVSITYCTSTRCGFFLWHYCHFVYVFIPICIFLFVCCGVPSIYCYFGSAEFLKKKAVDVELGKRLVQA